MEVESACNLLPDLHDVDEEESMLTCVNCRRVFGNEGSKSRHVCVGGRSRNDLLTAALGHANKLIEDGRVTFISAQQRGQSTLSAGDLDYKDAGFEEQIFAREWARRGKSGTMYGPKYIGPYKQRILQMFRDGNTDKKDKKNPSNMLAVLQSEHPGVLTLPSEQEIRMYVSSLTQRSKSGKNLAGSERGGQEPYRSVIIDILETSNYTLTATPALVKFKEEVPQLAEGGRAYPTDAQVKSLVSSLRAARRHSLATAQGSGVTAPSVSSVTAAS